MTKQKHGIDVCQDGFLPTAAEISYLIANHASELVQLHVETFLDEILLQDKELTDPGQKQRLARLRELLELVGAKQYVSAVERACHELRDEYNIPEDQLTVPKELWFSAQ